MQTIRISHASGGEARTHEIAVPVLGLGVFQAPSGEITRQAVRWALEAGYRHIDTAAIYGNEADVGAAVRASGVPRAEIHLTTKLWRSAQSTADVLRACDDSRAKLGIDQVDLYLVHAPVAAPARAAVWRGMEQLLAQGRVRAIGVSNFGVRHLEELLAYAQVRPAVNQLELTPYLQRRELVALCQAQGITLTAYSPLTKGRRLQDPPLVALAERLGKSPAQVLIRWGLQQGYLVIPKSVSRERIRENAAVFDFTIPPGDMALMAGWDEGLVTGWDPVSQP